MTKLRGNPNDNFNGGISRRKFLCQVLSAFAGLYMTTIEGCTNPLDILPKKHRDFYEKYLRERVGKRKIGNIRECEYVSKTTGKRIKYYTFEVDGELYLNDKGEIGFICDEKDYKELNSARKLGYLKEQIIQESKKIKVNEQSEILGKDFKSKVLAFATNYQYNKRNTFILYDKDWKVIGIFEFPKEIMLEDNDISRAERRKYSLEIAEKYGAKYRKYPGDDISIEDSKTFEFEEGISQEEYLSKSISEIATIYSNKTVNGDNKNRSRKQYLQDEIRTTTNDFIINDELSKFIVGQMGVESIYNNDKISDDLAVGIMQITPQVFIKREKGSKHINNSIGELKKEKNKDLLEKAKSMIRGKITIEDIVINGELILSKEELKKIREVKLSLILQAKFAKTIFNEFYNYFKNNGCIEKIANAYFDKNINNAKKYFIAPLIINSYHTGNGNVMKALKHFMELYPNKNSLVGCSGYDFFYKMTKVGKGKGGYGDSASEYVLKTFAMTKAINRESLKPRLVK